MGDTINFKEILERPEHKKVIITNPLFNKIANILKDDTVENKEECMIQCISNLCEMVDTQQKQLIKYMIKYGNNETSVNDVIKWGGLK